MPFASAMKKQEKKVEEKKQIKEEIEEEEEEIEKEEEPVKIGKAKMKGKEIIHGYSDSEYKHINVCYSCDKYKDNISDGTGCCYECDHEKKEKPIEKEVEKIVKKAEKKTIKQEKEKQQKNEEVSKEEFIRNVEEHIMEVIGENFQNIEKFMLSQTKDLKEIKSTLTQLATQVGILVETNDKAKKMLKKKEKE